MIPNPWALLDVRDLRAHPRTSSQRALDDAVDALLMLHDEALLVVVLARMRRVS